MGLTIHYSLHTNTPTRSQARRLVEQLRKAALDLPFAEVDELVVFQHEQTNFETLSVDDPHRWLLVQTMHMLEHGEAYHMILPNYVIAFRTWPGDGCEPANFGLCRYPATTEIDGQPVSTHCDGWRWSSFCKTQYASDPECGGVENFLRCHITVIRLLDEAKRMNILADVGDEGEFWEKRDVHALAETLGRWNRHIAGVVGRFKDASDGQIVAPITDFANFEHLEADGRRDEMDDTSSGDDRSQP
jgi:hypothetical protein